MIGLKNRGTKNVGCKQCGNGLVDFQITKSNEDLIDENINPITTIVKVVCGKCNIVSETVTIKGQFFIGAGQENVFIDVLDGKQGEMTVTARFKKYG